MARQTPKQSVIEHSTAKASHLTDAYLIALSGYAPDETRTRKAGFDAHVLKPVNTKQLEELVAKHEGVMSSPRRR